MAININSNMALGSAQYLDNRQSVADLDALLALDTNIIPNGFECYVEALDCKYKYHEDYNETNTGRWKLNISEGGEKKGEFLTKEKYDQLEADGLLQEDKNYYILGEAGGETGASTAFVITCDLATDTDEMGILNVSATFSEIYQACIGGKNVELKVYVDDTKTAYYSLIPSTVINEQIVFSMYQAHSGTSNIGITVYITSDDTYAVVFNEVDTSDLGGTETLIVTCEYSVDDNNSWTVSNVSETFATIDTALANNQEVILKAYPAGTTENPYILRPAMHYKNMGIMFELCVADGGQISGLNIMITTDNSVTATNDTYNFEEKQDKIEGTENQIVSFDAEGKVIAKDNEVIPIIENGKNITYHKVTKNRDITELEVFTDPNNNMGYKIDDLYLAYDCEKLAKGIDDWLAEKGITPVKGETYEDIAQIQVYSPSAGGYVYFSTNIQFDNTTYFRYYIKYNDTDYTIISAKYDYTNGKTFADTFSGLNVFNIAKIIPELVDCYIQSDILDVLHNWFELYKPIGLEDSVGLYSKQEALLNQDLTLNVPFESKRVGVFDLGNMVSLMTSPLQKLLFSVDSEGKNLKVFANDEKNRTSSLTNNFFGSNLLASKNTFATLNDMSTLPTPPDGALGIWTVVPDAAGQPESTNKGGTLIIAHITSMLYSQTVSYVGTRIAIYVTQGAIYYALGYGGKYYPTASWTPPSGGAFRWYKIASTLV